MTHPICPRAAAQLRMVLLALLPKDGTPLPMATLARLAAAKSHEVFEALQAAVLQGGVTYDPSTDSYAAKRQ